MTEPVDTISYKGYTIEVHHDDSSSQENPLKEDEGAPILVLHTKAEQHFGWTTDDDWGSRLNGALDQLAERGFTQGLRGERGALAVIRRWLRAYHGIEHVLPVGAGEHSGTWAYLGSGAHWCDPGGWDSGWVGWFFATPEQLERWGRSTNWTEQALIDSFSEFKAWVSDEIFGYIISDSDSDGDDIDDGSCWGFLGYDSFKEGRNDEPDGYMLEHCKSIIDEEIAHRRLKKAAADKKLPLSRRFQVTTICTADVTETWTFAVPNDWQPPEADDDADLLAYVLADEAIKFLTCDDHAENKRDREVTGSEFIEPIDEHPDTSTAFRTEAVDQVVNALLHWGITDLTRDDLVLRAAMRDRQSGQLFRAAISITAIEEI